MKMRTLFIFGALTVLSGCISPNPYGGGPAPVVDRTSVAGTSSAPGQSATRLDSPIGVEVTPLDQQQPLDRLTRDSEGLVIEDMPAPQPSNLPEVERRPKPATPPPQPDDGPNDAVVALLDSAAEHLGTQNLDGAAADLERAVRIEPNNAAIWHDLGQIRLRQSRYDDAMAMAAKSTGLAGTDVALKVLNWRLIAEARRSLGDNAGAGAAEATANQLEY